MPLIPELEALLERHSEASGNPASGPIFANGPGKALDLDSLYRRQMKEPLKAAGGSSGKAGTASGAASQQTLSVLA